VDKGRIARLGRELLRWIHRVAKLMHEKEKRGRRSLGFCARPLNGSHQSKSDSMSQNNPHTSNKRVTAFEVDDILQKAVKKT
jgi:hypothetical protein